MNKAREFLKQNIKNKSTVVVATSGGPDSMVLLDMVLKLKKDLNIICAHVNHGLREESVKEATLVKNFCAQNNIFFEYMTIDNYDNDNFHNDARNQRYEFFEKIVFKCQAKHLLTAHHGDDLIETILMRIVRGSNLKGYAGFLEKIEKNNYNILRPLIFHNKEEILDYAEKNKVPFMIDSSNEKDIYTRNRFRKTILPLLKKEDANVHEKFYKFSRNLELYSNYIDKKVKKELDKIYINQNLNINKFKKLDKAVQLRLINIILEELYQDELFLINDKHTEAIMNLIYNGKANQKVSLPNKIALKSYEFLQIKNDIKISSYKVLLEEKTYLPNNRTIEIVKKTEEDSNFICRLNTKEINMPLYIRNRLDGDKIAIKGLGGTKKIKDVFIDEKVSLEERNNWPILVDNKDEILWLPGLKKSKFNKQKKENYDIIIKYI